MYQPLNRKSDLLSNLKDLLSELELSRQKASDISDLLKTMCLVSKYVRWSSQGKVTAEWARLLERTELVFLSKLKPKTSELKDFKDSLHSRIGKCKHHDTTPKELERLWDKWSKFFIDETENTEDLRQIIVKRDNHKCRYCGAKESENNTLHLHHVIPKQKYGGANTIYNLVAACSTCNLKIGQDIEFPEDWEAKGETDADSSV